MVKGLVLPPHNKQLPITLQFFILTNHRNESLENQLDKLFTARFIIQQEEITGVFDTSKIFSNNVKETNTKKENRKIRLLA